MSGRAIATLLVYFLAGGFLSMAGVSWRDWQFYPLMALYGVAVAIWKEPK